MGCWGVGFQVLAQSKTEHSLGIVHGGYFKGIAATIAVNCAWVTVLMPALSQDSARNRTNRQS